MLEKVRGVRGIRNVPNEMSTTITRLQKYIRQRRQNPGSYSTPVFLIGSGRSGTNMLASNLAKSWQVDLFNEDNPAAFEKWFLKDFTVIETLVERSYAPIVLFKSLKDTYRANIFLSNFPTSKILFIFRHHNDVVNSALKKFYDENGLVIKPVFADRRAPVLRWIDTDFAEFSLAPPPNETKQFIKSMWKPSLNLESTIALDWLFTNRLFFELGLFNSNRVCLISYEKVVMEPVEAFQFLSNFLDMSFDPKMAKDIFSSSVKRDPAPELDDHIESECDALWERLRSHI